MEERTAGEMELLVTADGRWFWSQVGRRVWYRLVIQGREAAECLEEEMSLSQARSPSHSGGTTKTVAE